ncbi:hypothetical protein DTO166G4_9052 [Paecilomyces variotii]|nr:hypothetical protein DTO166G4_9052 [Paecilomyces variotii]KAJ9237715.1 hypothetical protein DTO166G5_3479 [Paecilomyces variotii]KAJ9238975.1 hypothetical protein DTO169E5_4573 [Paecilomyces variotii]KAJ9261246.1 hypothetical protein DTO195F2_4272 [Paecilomyces variotii]KAJ9372863.1 hypothetical protein DTO282E5_2590 [Paecilomyces variotii]
MFSPPVSPLSTSRATKGRREQQTRTRTVAPKRVYGKRKANAPRAILEHVSPLREKTADVDAGETALDDMQAKLEAVKLDDDVEDEDNPVVEENGNKDAELVEAMEVVTLEDKRYEDDNVKTGELMFPIYTPTKKRDSVGEVRQRIREHIASTPLKHTPKPKRRWQVLAEVRLPVKPACSAQEEQPAKDTSTSNTKVVTKDQTKKKSRPRLSSSCIKDEKTNAYVRPILDEAMSPIASQGVQKFDSWAARTGDVFDVVKIAEGSYGEVYKLRIREDACKQQMSKSKLAKLRAYGDGVFKIVPLRAKTGPGSRKFTSIDEIASEVKLLKYLDPIPGFARFREIHVVQGRFPGPFQAAWDIYSQTKDDCWNPNPADKKAYPDKQLWAILEMDDAGCELEKFKWSSVFQIYDIFWGVAMALARAEEYARFEHRDLHLGNVCLRTTRQDGSMEPPSSVDSKVLESSSGFGLSCLETTIIDYTLSRAELRYSEDPEEQPEIASTDLDKKQIFDAVGVDEDEKLLRNTYRYMRGEVYKGDPLDQEKPEDIPGIWSEYTPRTNLIWLLFLLKNLLKHKKDNQEKQSQAPRRQPLGVASGNVNKNIKPKPTAKSQSGKKKTKVLATDLENEEQVVTTNEEGPSKKVEQTLSSRLDRALELLDLENGHEDMCCAADLVAYAIDSQWLDEKDFFNA